MTKKYETCTTMSILRKNANLSYSELGDWEAVGKRFGISGGMAYRIAMQDYEPRDNKIRHILNLPELVLVEACTVCGGAHPITHPRQAKPRKWRDLPTAALKLALDNREEW